MTVSEGQTASNSGTWSDPGVDVVTLTASVGTVTKNANGTWSWSFNTADGPDQSQTVTITATDSDGAASTTTFSLVVNNVAPAVGAGASSVAVNEGQTAVRVALREAPFYENDYSAQDKFAAVVAKRNEVWKRIDKGWKIYEPLPQEPEEARVWKQFVSEWDAWKRIENEQVATITALSQVTSPFQITTKTPKPISYQLLRKTVSWRAVLFVGLVPREVT